MGEFAATPGQTVGPFLHCGLPFAGDNRLADDGYPAAIRLHGTVYDGAGQGVPDALVELWQADPDGRSVRRAGALRRDPAAFTGWGRCATDADGHYEFTTIRPGGPAPFFAIAVFARGLLDVLFTRGYLPDGGGGEPALPTGLDTARRETLLCVADSGGYRFDIHLQGPRETVFLAFGGDRR